MPIDRSFTWESYENFMSKDGTMTAALADFLHMPASMGPSVPLSIASMPAAGWSLKTVALIVEDKQVGEVPLHHTCFRHQTDPFAPPL